MNHLCIDAEQLRAALADIERAESNGFNHCLAVFQMATAGPMISDNTATYSDMIERAHPTNGAMDWGRFQGVSRRNRWNGTELVPLEPNA